MKLMIKLSVLLLAVSSYHTIALACSSAVAPMDDHQRLNNLKALLETTDHDLGHLLHPIVATVGSITELSESDEKTLNGLVDELQALRTELLEIAKNPDLALAKNQLGINANSFSKTLSGVKNFIESKDRSWIDGEIQVATIQATKEAQSLIGKLGRAEEFIENGSFPLVNSHFRLGDLIPPLDSDGLVANSDDLNTMIFGDLHELRRVVRNFLSNARKFTTKGTIQVHLKLEARTTNGKIPVTLKVMDTGPGISKDKQKLLFKYRSQVGTPEENARGKGLGLFISKQIILTHGGKVLLTSKTGTGHGSTFGFRIEFPTPMPMTTSAF